MSEGRNRRRAREADFSLSMAPSQSPKIRTCREIKRLTLK